MTGYDVEHMAWNPFPDWFQNKVLESGKNFIDYSQQAFMDPRDIKNRIDWKNGDEVLVAPPEPPKKILKFPEKNATSGEWLTMDVPLVFDQEKFESDISLNKFIFMAEQHNWYFPALNGIGEVVTQSFQTKNS